MALTISDICLLFARKGGREYDGEGVSQLRFTAFGLLRLVEGFEVLDVLAGPRLALLPGIVVGDGRGRRSDCRGLRGRRSFSLWRRRLHGLHGVWERKGDDQTNGDDRRGDEP